MRELNYFTIDRCYGGYQEWFTDRWMRIGGCGAVAACDSCVYLAREKGLEHIYPYDRNRLTREDYLAFAKVMRPYLRPRMGGIDTLELYIHGFGRYLREHGEYRLHMNGIHGSEPVQTAEQVMMKQIDAGLPVPCLTLRHKNPDLADYVWHWYMLTGYQQADDLFLVKAVTYGEWRWLDFRQLWDTGYRKKGGLIQYCF
ncbi:MAG: hypothetical protein ACI4PM_04245 [Butyricicoccus sp.]